jgi:glycerol dehydrogenase
MKSILIAPRKYIQGKDVLKEAGPYIGLLGKKALLLWSARGRSCIGPLLLPSLKSSGVEVVDVEFRGETTKAEAARVAQIARDSKADVLIGIGGGKLLDTAKAAAASAATKMVSCPTIASTDSPTSSYTVWYDDKHVCLGFESWGVNPDLVLVDSQVIADAPVRSFVAGMADGLSTGLEAEVVYSTHGDTLAGGKATLAAMAIARLCNETILKYGIDAKRDVEQHIVTPAVEAVIEANTLLSGLGFESCGVATAHMIANCLPGFPECKGLMHGEEVSFGIVTQLCLDKNMPRAEANQIVDFQIALGLPVTFADLNLAGITRERLKKIGDICAGPGSLCHHHPFKITSESVVDAMFTADALGRERKKRLS